MAPSSSRATQAGTRPNLCVRSPPPTTYRCSPNPRAPWRRPGESPRHSCPPMLGFSGHARRLPDEIDALARSVTDGAIGSDDGAGSDVADCAASGAAWVRDWIDAGEACLAAARDERTSVRKSTDTGEAASAQEFQSTARAVTEYLAAQDVTVFAASSNSVRYLSEAADIRAHIHASRGLAGIDGLVSSATGLSLGLDEPVVLLIGDIAMLHDIGGLLTPTAEMAG